MTDKETNWTHVCTEFLKEIMTKAKLINAKSTPTTEDMTTATEFQRSYISFPEFNESNISSSESEMDSTSKNSQYWLLSNSSSFHHQ
jgi:hypothetical protein